MYLAYNIQNIFGGRGEGGGGGDNLSLYFRVGISARLLAQAIVKTVGRVQITNHSPE